MKTLRVAFRVALAIALVSAAPAGAQLAFDASAGFATPVGQYGTGLSTGVDLMGGVEWHPVPLVPFTMRVELGWDRFGAAAGFVGNEYLTRFLVDGIVDLPLPGRFRPYAIAGVGAYHLSVNSLGRYGVGVNVGGGLQYRFPLVQPFFEVRYQHAFMAGGVQFVPFQFGVRIVVL
jgi:Outer membrane protein beta-barrel domain